MSITVYGIKNCDTVKKARKWLESNTLDYQFSDFRADGLDAADLDQWLAARGWETLLNKRSTTWKNLPEQSRQNIDQSAAKKLMLENPTLIKRPVTVANGEVLVGFKADEYAAEFGQ